MDTSWLGWRWCFYVGIPFAAVALVLLQRALHLPVVRRQVTIDYLGATLVAASVSLLLIWVSLAGHQFATQNVVATSDLGAATSTVAFFRSLGGAVGALLAHGVATYTADGLAAVGVVPAGGGAGAELPNPATLPPPIRQVVQDAFGHGIGDVFLAALPFAVLALLAVVFVKEVTLQTKSAIERDAEIPATAAG